MKYLALDIGMRRTGVAFLDDAVGIPLPLDTIHHQSTEELVDVVSTLVQARGIDQLVIGLPLLPSGEEGSQVELVRAVAAQFEAFNVPIKFVDERYTTGKRTPPRRAGPTSEDDNAAAATHLLDSIA